MEIKHLIQRFNYRIEEKPEGGFIGRSSDPTVPLLEAPTRAELQQKIQENVAASLAPVFPGLKIPLQNQQRRFEVHIERTGVGGFSVHSKEVGVAGGEGASHEKLDHYAEEMLSFLNQHFPQLAETLVASGGAVDLKTLSQATGVTVDGNAQASGQVEVLPPVDRGVSAAGPGSASDRMPGSGIHFSARFGATGEPVSNSPITSRTGGSWPILRFLLMLLIVALVMYFFLHRR